MSAPFLGATATATVAGTRRFLRLTPEFVDPATRCVAETFAGQEDPFTRLFGLSKHSWAQMAGPFIARAARSKVPLSGGLWGER